MAVSLSPRLFYVLSMSVPTYFVAGGIFYFNGYRMVGWAKGRSLEHHLNINLRQFSNDRTPEFRIESHLDQLNWKARIRSLTIAAGAVPRRWQAVTKLNNWIPAVPTGQTRLNFSQIKNLVFLASKQRKLMPAKASSDDGENLWRISDN